MRMAATVFLAAVLLASALPSMGTAAAHSVSWTTHANRSSWPIYIDEQLTVFWGPAALVVDLFAVATSATGTAMWNQSVVCEQNLDSGSVFRLSRTTLGVLCSTDAEGLTLYTLNHANGSIVRQVKVPSLGTVLPVEAAGAVCVQPLYGATPLWCMLSTGAIFTLPQLDGDCSNAEYENLHAYNTTLAVKTNGCGVGAITFFDLASGAAVLGNVTSAPFVTSESFFVSPPTLQDGRFLTSLVRPSVAGAYAAVQVVDLQYRTAATSDLTVPQDLWPHLHPTFMNNFIAGYRKETDTLSVLVTGPRNASSPVDGMWLWSVVSPAQQGQPATVGLHYTVAIPETDSWNTQMECQLGGDSSLLFCASAEAVSTAWSEPPLNVTTSGDAACPLAGPVAVLRVADGSAVYTTAWGAAVFQSPSQLSTLPNGMVVAGKSALYGGSGQCVSTFNATSGQPLWTAWGFLVGPEVMWSAPGCVPVGRLTEEPSVACIANTP